MAVYDRTYQGYAGPLTPERGRFLILPRYALRDVFRSRLFTAFFAACFLYPLACGVIIYLHHNLSALSFLQISRASLLSINATFFLWFLRVQCTILGFLVAFVVGPALVAPDLRNNALPLFLSRPFSRTEYVLGKMSVLVLLLSAITWIPGILLFALESYLDGSTWLQENARVALAILVGSWIWILLLSLLSLAVSATFKWKPLASAALFAIFLVGSAFAAAVNLNLGTTWGSFVDLSKMAETVWAALMGVPSTTDGFPVAAAWVSLLLACGISLLLLARKLRAYEVVR